MIEEHPRNPASITLADLGPKGSFRTTPLYTLVEVGRNHLKPG